MKEHLCMATYCRSQLNPIVYSLTFRFLVVEIIKCKIFITVPNITIPIKIDLNPIFHNSSDVKIWNVTLFKTMKSSIS